MTDASATADTSPTPAPVSAKEEAVDTIRFLALLAVAVLIFRSFFLSPFNIPSESMQPRLLIGDYLLVNKMAYGYSKYSLPFSIPLIPGHIFARTPERGDVVVFKAPPQNKDDWIKRVIGLPGDTIQVRGGIVWINGKPLKREPMADFVIPVTPNMIDAARANNSLPCYEIQFEEIGANGQRQCRYKQFKETMPNGKSYAVLDIKDLPVDNTAPYTVPEGSVFLMGDNRDRSADSRVPMEEGGLGGAVPQKNLVGHALVGMFSTDGSASWFNPISWFTAARWERIGDGF
ncbi:signal peptidase I [Sphingopyxis panaciterrulae]|uniref:Signal peptidase I n=1 Tax=Sphingopyxis panaciterrulae TaxID=462372 RepID=A0A7W9B6J0_9SPHN|nr:signal peptidase I [Sphingopyxis panaciterrulae]MBB5706927.1 signal peptidase I [Sphingopyxis panaciterrulae]